jgi:hypothetical protein
MIFVASAGDGGWGQEEAPEGAKDEAIMPLRPP